MNFLSESTFETHLELFFNDNQDQSPNQVPDFTTQFPEQEPEYEFKNEFPELNVLEIEPLIPCQEDHYGLKLETQVHYSPEMQFQDEIFPSEMPYQEEQMGEIITQEGLQEITQEGTNEHHSTNDDTTSESGNTNLTAAQCKRKKRRRRDVSFKGVLRSCRRYFLTQFERSTNYSKQKKYEDTGFLRVCLNKFLSETDI